MNLINLITEELNGLLNEFTDEEYVSKNDIILREEYDKLNQQLFDSKLPNNVTLGWDNMKRAYGVVNGYHNRRTGEVILKNLLISSVFKYTYRQFKNILAHEMIHVWQMGVMGERGGHGWDFMKQADRINGMGLGFNITEKNGEDILVSDATLANTKKRTLIAIILNIDGRYGLAITTPNVYKEQFDIIPKVYERLVNGGKYREVEINVVETQNPQLNALPITRSFQKAIRYSLLSDRLLEELLNDNIIKSVRIRKGVPMEVSEEKLSEDVMLGNQKEWEEISIT